MRFTGSVIFAIPEPESEYRIVAERLPRIRSHFDKHLAHAVWPNGVEFQKLCDRYDRAETEIRAEDRQQLRAIVGGEYDAAFFDETLAAGREVTPDLQRAVERLDELLAPSFEPFRPPVWLTRYGAGGCYSPSRQGVFVRAAKPLPAGFGGHMRRIALHEVIHLYLEPLVRKHKLQHWEKEGLVDLFANRLFGTFGWYYQMQPNEMLEPLEELFEALPGERLEVIVAEYRRLHPLG